MMCSSLNSGPHLRTHIEGLRIRKEKPKRNHHVENEAFIFAGSLVLGRCYRGHKPFEKIIFMIPSGLRKTASSSSTWRLTTEAVGSQFKSQDSAET